MKKTMMVLLVVLFLVPAGLFAGIFDLSIGATAQYNSAVSVSDGFEWQDGMADVENYAFGPDLRLRVLFAEVDVAGLYTQLPTGHKIGGLVTGGLSLDLLGLVRVGLGIGPRMAVTFDEEWGNAQLTDSSGTVITADTDLVSAFKNSPMTYRATVDLKLGKMLVGLNYIIDSAGFTFEDSDYTKLEPNFDAGGTVGVSLLFTLF